ncbi:hypothetical protein SAMN05421890_0684 [Ensifer adhaerens]|nr:hypothetical protein SAMN05421890_0684 [Ensifer adhaerens]HZG29678.1 hypothetical protein [Ensifer sp.]
MNNWLYWVAIVAILIIGAVVYFSSTGTTDQPAKDRPTPHAIDQGNG